jgi:hypothetical protein
MQGDQQVNVYRLFECDPEFPQEPFIVEMDVTDASVGRGGFWHF